MTPWNEMSANVFLFAIIILSSSTLPVRAQPRVIIERNSGAAATAKFKFKNVPSPARDDAAAKAEVTIVDAAPDPNSADVIVLTDGLVPDSEDQPRRNFFNNAGRGGGRRGRDFGKVLGMRQG